MPLLILVDGSSILFSFFFFSSSFVVRFPSSTHTHKMCFRTMFNRMPNARWHACHPHELRLLTNDENDIDLRDDNRTDDDGEEMPKNQDKTWGNVRTLLLPFSLSLRILTLSRANRIPTKKKKYWNAGFWYHVPSKRGVRDVSMLKRLLNGVRGSRYAGNSNWLHLHGINSGFIFTVSLPIC